MRCRSTKPAHNTTSEIKAKFRQKALPILKRLLATNCGSYRWPLNNSGTTKHEHRVFSLSRRLLSTHNDDRLILFCFCTSTSRFYSFLKDDDSIAMDYEFGSEELFKSIAGDEKKSSYTRRFVYCSGQNGVIICVRHVTMCS